jgi:dephospho-CoA kinase
MSKLIQLGLTGSIGMGKSATLALFAEMGAAIYDADATVHKLYAKGGEAVPLVEAAFPGVVKDGAVDRQELSKHVVGKPEAMKMLESIVHPLTFQHRETFLKEAAATTDIAVLDIPLLYEGGVEKLFDAVVVCSAPVKIQIARALKRPTLDYAKLHAIISKQTPDWKKRMLADYVVDTSRGVEDARVQVAAILKDVRSPEWRRPAKQAKSKA